MEWELVADLIGLFDRKIVGHTIFICLHSNEEPGKIFQYLLIHLDFLIKLEKAFSWLTY